MKRGFRPSGDLIPWTVSEQFQDSNFGALNGVRVVRIATHPSALGKGYGSRALDQLQQYYEGALLDPENIVSNEHKDLYETKEEEKSSDFTKLKPKKGLKPIL